MLLHVSTHKCGLQTIPRMNHLKVTETAARQGRTIGAKMQVILVFLVRLGDSIISFLEK